MTDILQAARLAKHHFGLDARAQRLPSDRDENFRLTTDEGKRFVLKIADPGEDPDCLRAQNRALLHLAEQVDFCPRPIPSKQGHLICEENWGDSKLRLIRMLAYLPGAPLAETKPHAPELLTDVGRRLSQLRGALLDFDDPAFHRSFDWDLESAADLIEERRSLIPEGDLRRWVDAIRGRFGEETTARMRSLPRGVIHNDPNDYNLIVRRDADPTRCRVSGLIDFGDMIYGARAADLAIAMAYALLDKNDPLAAAQSLVRGYHQVHPLNQKEREALFGMICLRLALSVCMAAHQAPQRPGDAYLTISQEAIRRTLPRLMAIPRGYAEACFRQACSTPSPSKEETRHERTRHIAAVVRMSYSEPLRIVRGFQQYLYDDNGRRYLDAYNNVPHVGHCHPRVVEAAAEQMRLLNTNTRYLHENLNRLAKRLAATLPEPLQVCFFLNSASEANELAVRLARTFTGRRGVIVLEHAYHGHTTTLIDLSPYKHAGPGGGGAPDWVHTAPIPDVFRGPFKGDDPRAGAKYAGAVAEILEGIEKKGGAAAFLAETCPSVGGQIVPPAGYLKAVYRSVRRAGGLCIADEVQTGYGRLGSCFYAFEDQGVTPDIVVLGKPMGNGHPLAAVVTTRPIAEAFDNGMEFFSTFGGNTVSCAVGLAVLDVLAEEDLQAHARRVGEHLLERLRPLKERFPIVGDVRGSGLFVGLELVLDRNTLAPAGAQAARICERMREEGILIGTDGPHHNVLKIRPPMPFGMEDADLLVDTLADILDQK